MSSKKYMLLAAALVGAIASPLVMADSVVGVKSETVRYDDLRLSSPVAIAVLHGRLRHAAERACGQPDTRQLATATRYRKCVDDAMATAIAEINEPRLAEYHKSKQNKGDSTNVPEVKVVATNRE